MACTAQMVRSQQKSDTTWSSIFPQEQVTETQSALFVKKLMAVAVSNITYLRAIFPEQAFGDRCLEDLNLKILRDDSTCPGASQVIKWVKGCYDAMDKKYLRSLIIGIYTDPDKPDDVIESYTFKFSYENNETGVDIYRNKQKISSAQTAAETKKATIRLLRTIVVLTQSLSSLPDNVMVTMKLLYYDEITPPDYEPPGFTKAECDVFNFEEDPMNIKVGDVATPFHTVKLRIKTDGRQFETVSEDSDPLTKTECACDTEDPNKPKTDIESKSPALDPVEGDLPSTQTPEKPGLTGEATDSMGTQAGSAMSQFSQEQGLGVRCTCGCNEDDGLMILCAVCRFWQHGICYLISSEDDAPLTHVCHVCADVTDDENMPTDPQLVGLNEVDAQAKCLWRRSLVVCREMSRLQAPTFARRLGVEIPIAQGIINRLEEEGFLKMTGKGRKMAKVVDPEKLKIGINTYFKNVAPNLENPQDISDITIVKEDNSQKSCIEVDSVIESLAMRADDIDLSETHSDVCDDDPAFVVNFQKRVKKRVKPITDEDTEFEISFSPEKHDDSESEVKSMPVQPQPKRRKASVASKVVKV